MTLSWKDNTAYTNILIILPLRALKIFYSLNMKFEIQLLKQNTSSKILRILRENPLVPPKGSSNAYFFPKDAVLDTHNNWFTKMGSIFNNLGFSYPFDTSIFTTPYALNNLDVQLQDSIWPVSRCPLPGQT